MSSSLYASQVSRGIAIRIVDNINENNDPNIDHNDQTNLINCASNHIGFFCKYIHDESVDTDGATAKKVTFITSLSKLKIEVKNEAIKRKTTTIIDVPITPCQSYKIDTQISNKVINSKSNYHDDWIYRKDLNKHDIQYHKRDKAVCYTAVRCTGWIITLIIVDTIKQLGYSTHFNPSEFFGAIGIGIVGSLLHNCIVKYCSPLNVLCDNTTPQNNIDLIPEEGLPKNPRK